MAARLNVVSTQQKRNGQQEFKLNISIKEEEGWALEAWEGTESVPCNKTDTQKKVVTVCARVWKMLNIKQDSFYSREK